MLIEKVYFVNRGKVSARLRVKIDGYCYRCGQSVRNSPFWIQRIEASGEITLVDSHSGHKIETKALQGISKVLASDLGA